MVTKILVVDDDKNICDLLRMYLEKEGYEVKTASDGVEGVTAFRMYEPDMVLLDIMMPKKDGWQVCREIREHSSKPIIMITAKGETIDEQRVRYLITLVNEGNDAQVAQMAKDVVCITAKGKPIKAKTVGQQNYMKAIMKNTITIGVGPAGTGKTYLAVAAAVAAFRERTVNRIILTRPAVEAGERLGFLPGDLQNKVDPYLRPLYDALYDMLGAETFQKYQERGSIEVAPLAYMRGRTLDDSFIILDEAQNTTREQMKMFLTRLGFGSKIVITGDVTQIDLPDDKVSGLKDAVRVLDGVKDIAICRLTAADVVRHALVQEIISAYERSAQKKEVKKPTRQIQGRYHQRKN